MDIVTPEEKREKNRLCSERWRRAHGIGPRKPAQQPWLAEGISRSTWYRRKQAREREALTVVATAREAVFDRLDWQLARLRRELETAARFADEGAAIITELPGYSGSSGRYHTSRQGRACSGYNGGGIGGA